MDAHNNFEKKVVFKVDTVMKYTSTTKERIAKAQQQYQNLDSVPFSGGHVHSQDYFRKKMTSVSSPHARPTRASIQRKDTFTPFKTNMML